MFDAQDVFGGSSQPSQSGYEENTPALPAAGASPDGMGGDGTGNFQIPFGNAPRAPAGPPRMMAPATPGAAIIPIGQDAPLGPMAGQTWQNMEPSDVSSPAAVRSAGFTALLVAAGVGLGYAAGGPWGAAAGMLATSAVANGYRAQKWWDSADPSEKHESVVSGVFAAGATGMGVYAAYLAYQQKQEE